MLYSHRRVSPISRFAANRDGSRFPIPGEIGNGGFPDSRFRPNRESGIPSPIPGRIGNRGNGNWGFPGVVTRQLGLPPARSPRYRRGVVSPSCACAGGAAPSINATPAGPTGTCWCLRLPIARPVHSARSPLSSPFRALLADARSDTQARLCQRHMPECRNNSNRI